MSTLQSIIRTNFHFTIHLSFFNLQIKIIIIIFELPKFGAIEHLKRQKLQIKGQDLSTSFYKGPQKEKEKTTQIIWTTLVFMN